MPLLQKGAEQQKEEQRLCPLSTRRLSLSLGWQEKKKGGAATASILLFFPYTHLPCTIYIGGAHRERDRREEGRGGIKVSSLRVVGSQSSASRRPRQTFHSERSFSTSSHFSYHFPRFLFLSSFPFCDSSLRVTCILPRLVDSFHHQSSKLCQPKKTNKFNRQEREKRRPSYVQAVVISWHNFMASVFFISQQN